MRPLCFPLNDRPLSFLLGPVTIPSMARIYRLSRARFDEHVSVVVEPDHASFLQSVLSDKFNRERDEKGTSLSDNPPFNFFNHIITVFVRRLIAVV